MTDTEALFLIADAAEEAGDFERARASFERGAALGDEACLSRLAYLHAMGRGVPVDKKIAMRLYLRAWRLGSAVAPNNIAILYRERNNARGMVRWFRRAVDAGDDGAHIELAKLHLAGRGVAQSPELAMRHLAAALRGGWLSEAEREEAEMLRDRLRPRRV